MSDEPQIVKTIIPAECPHCNKEIFLGYEFMAPMLTQRLRREDIKNAKDEVRKKMEEIKFNKPEDKEDVIKWLDNEQTYIGKSDVEEILQQIILNQKDEKVPDKNTD